MLPDNGKGLSPLEALVIERLGGKTTIVESLVTVGTTRGIMLVNNPNRIFWAMINEGTSSVRVSNDPDIGSTSGWLLSSNGGVIMMIYDEDGEAVGQQVFGIASIAGQVVRVRETVRL
jgi:hypothetical protein